MAGKQADLSIILHGKTKTQDPPVVWDHGLSLSSHLFRATLNVVQGTSFHGGDVFGDESAHDSMSRESVIQ